MGVLFDTAVETHTIRGTITRLIYHERGRVIARIMMDLETSDRDANGKRRTVSTVLGSMTEPMVGQLYEFSGIIEFDSKYTQYQMRFDSYRTVLPTDRDGVASYLCDVAKWVGPKTASALIDAFGSDTLQVLREEPDRVVAANIVGLTADRVAEMSRSLKDNAALEAAAVELNNLLGKILGPATVRKALKKWGCDAGTLVKNNPYVLIELHGVGFDSADSVHKKLGRDPKDLQRHLAALCHILKSAAQKDGHTYLTRMNVEAEGKRLVGGLIPEVWAACEELELATTQGGIVCLGEYSKAEQYVGNKLVSMLASDREATNARCYPVIDTEGLAPDQAAAVATIQNSPVAILTGAPGTGKTYTLARIVRSLTANGATVALAAPTGKAAKQMALALASVSGGSASTIHSLLEPCVNEETREFTFAAGPENPLPFDVVVVDEFSMVDINLCRNLLRALKETTRLLLVGDHYQLPSVGPGAVLRDLITAGIPSHELKEIKRNAGTIVKSCHAIKDGAIPVPDARLNLETGANWRHLEAGTSDDIKHTISMLFQENLREMGVDLLWGVQVISPVNDKGPLSCESFNTLIKSLLNPRPNAEKLKFAVGDKVVRTKNGRAEGQYLNDDGSSPLGCDGEVRIVNGDLGIVTDVDAKHVTCRLRYPDRIVRIPRSETHLQPAYCLTCHKMQGSEVDVVILPLHRDLSSIPMMAREWLYTAMSRAKRFIITVGHETAIKPIIQRVGNTRRQTMLASWIRERLGALPVSGPPQFDDF